MARHYIPTSLLLVCLTVVLPPPLPAQDQDGVDTKKIESDVRAVMLEMRRAAEGLDADALYAFVLDSATPPIIEDGRLASTRSEALRRTALGLRGIDSLSYQYTQESVTVLSLTSALWVGTGTTTARLSDGRQISVPFAETVLFVHRGDQWKVLHAHRSAPDG